MSEMGMHEEGLRQLAHRLGVVSPTMLSNIFTMHAATDLDVRQRIPHGIPVMPPANVLRLRAELILEEAIETIHALGFSLRCEVHKVSQELETKNDFQLVPNRRFDLWEVVDGCCDEIYVCTGTLASLGVPDLPHLAAVCTANDAKFPKGVGIVNAAGKYQKPEDWAPPDHKEVASYYCEIDVLHVALDAVHRFKCIK